jgi:hypothetical protein
VTKPSEVIRGNQIDAYLGNYLRHQLTKVEIYEKHKKPTQHTSKSKIMSSYEDNLVDLKVIGEYETGHIYTTVPTKLMVHAEG